MRILLLAVGGLVLLGIVGLGLLLFIGSQGGLPTAGPGSTDPQSQPETQQPSEPGGEPADQPEGGGADGAIDAGNGVSVQPAPGYLPEQSEAVLLLTEDRACYLNLIVQKDADFKGTATLRNEANRENEQLKSKDFTTGEPEVKQPSNSTITFMGSMSWSATINAANGPVKVAGYTTLIQRKDGLVSVVRFMTPADRASQEQPKRDQMLDSIAASQ